MKHQLNEVNGLNETTSETTIQYIDTQQSLEEFIAKSKGSSVLAIDTEFLREKTYYPQLCLIQLATDEHEAIIDPLASLDLTPLIPLFTDERVTKVFHAGDQDRAILYQMLGVVVRPVFDTQHAVLLLGLPQQMSLIALVRHYCGVNLKKGESFSDWAQRPLTQTQLNYAVDDVHFLPLAYRKIVSELEERGRLAWLEDDFRAMEDEGRYRIDERDVWRKLKGTATLKGRQLAVAQEVAVWRERAAQKRNIPRKWILPDELLVEIARREPDSLEALFSTRGLREKLGRIWSREVLAAVKVAVGRSPDEWPTLERPPARDAGIAVRLDLMNAVVHHRARGLHIAGSFLVSHNELVRLAAGQRDGLLILQGWRRELLGDELLDLLAGRLSLSLAGEGLSVRGTDGAGAPTR
jgi:ribonuclease D